MKSFIFAAPFAVAAVTIGSLAFAASAMADTATAQTCQTLGQQVNMGVNGTIAHANQVRSEQRAGLLACQAGNFDEGASHYQKALDLMTGASVAQSGGSANPSTLR